MICCAMCFTLEMPCAHRGTGRSAAIGTAAADRHYRTSHSLGNAMHLSNIRAEFTIPRHGSMTT